MKKNVNIITIPYNFILFSHIINFTKSYENTTWDFFSYKTQKRFFIHIIEDFLTNEKFFNFSFLEKFFFKSFPIYLNDKIIEKDFNFELDEDLIKFLCLKNIFFSDSSIDWYIYYKTVWKYNRIPKNLLIQKLDLPENFFDEQKQIERSFKNKFWSEVPYSWFFYDTEDRYQDDILIPYEKNEYIVRTVEAEMNPYSPWYWYYGWCISSTFYYEVFHFIWGTREQSMFDFWTLMSIWSRATVFQHIIYAQPGEMEGLRKAGLKYFQSGAHDMLYALVRIFWQLFERLREKQEILHELTDIIINNFDKNFSHAWSYMRRFEGSDKTFLDYADKTGMTCWLQKLRTLLLEPTLQHLSPFTINNNPYSDSYEKAIYMSVYPESLIPKGRFNEKMDGWDCHYNWFFHSGYTYMDGAAILDNWRYYSTRVEYGDFDFMFEDFPFYQPAYLTDFSTVLRIPFLDVLLWDDLPRGDYRVYLYNYNNMFEFTRNPNVQLNYHVDKLFHLTNDERLELFHDEVQIDQKLFQSERLACLFHGYNVSSIVNNNPAWYTSFWYAEDLKESMGLYTEFDEVWERYQNKLIRSWNLKYYDHPIYMHSKFSKFSTYLEFFNQHLFMQYFNQKLYDDVGFFFTSIMRGEQNISWSPYLNFNNFIIKYTDLFSFPNQTWASFYSVFKFLDISYLKYDRSIFWYDGEENRYIYNFFKDLFEIGWRETLVREVFMRHRNVFNYAANCPRYIGFYFLIRLDKILGLFFDLNYILNAWIFYPLHFFIYSEWPIFSFFTKEQFIEFFFFFKKLLEEKKINVEICNEPIETYFEILNYIYNTKTFQYIFDLIFKQIIVTYSPRISVTKLKYDKYPYNVSVIDFVDCTAKPVGLEFFFFFLKRPKTDLFILNEHIVKLPFDIKLSDYFTNTELTFDQYLEKLILIMMVNQLLLDETKINSYNLNNIILELNDLNKQNIKLLEYSRYINYVLKHNLYCEPKQIYEK